MSKFVKVAVSNAVVSIAVVATGYFVSMGMAVDTLKKHFASENNKTFAMVKASVSSVKCDDLFEDKEDESEILCREQINSTLEGIFKEGVNAEMRANNGAAFFSRENASKMDTVSESLISLANLQPAKVEAEIMYEDVDGNKEENGVLTILREPVEIYKALDTIRAELIQLFAILGTVLVLVTTLMSFLFLRKKRKEAPVAPVK